MIKFNIKCDIGLFGEEKNREETIHMQFHDLCDVSNPH